MRKLFYLILCVSCALMAGCPLPSTPDVAGDLEKLSSESGAKYYMYVPTWYNENRDWPLVVTLHGSLGWDGPMRQVKEFEYLAERHGFIVVAPNLKSAEGIIPILGRERLFRKDEKNTLAIMDEVSEKYRIDTESVLLTGFSAGGYPMYYIGLKNPGRFNMLISRSGNCSQGMFEKFDEEKTLPEDIKNLKVVVFWGKDDISQIKSDGWYAFRWLRQHGVSQAEMKKLKGGHLRRPRYAYERWMPFLAERHRVDTEQE